MRILLFWALCAVAVLASYELNFIKCDRDHSLSINLEELSGCLKSSFSSHSSIDYVKDLLHLFDKGGDGELTSDEFDALIHFMKIKQKKDAAKEVDYISRDGASTSITMEKLNNLLESAEKERVKFQDTQENIAHLESLSKSNPDAAIFIAIGRWAYDSLVHVGSIKRGSGLMNLKSISSADGAQDKLQAQHIEAVIPHIVDKFHLRLLLTVSQEEAPKVLQVYEVSIEHDTEKYKKPYLAIVDAWKLNMQSSEREHRIAIPQPRIRNLRRTITIVSVFFAIAMAIVVFIGNRNTQKPKSL